ncbi:MAG: hypothetical protein ABR970_18075 [Roseiarcus sp.]|jgi:hypothetical protein
MYITPISILGLLLGALLGVFVTPMRVTDLREEASRAFSRARLSKLFGRPAHRGWLAHLVWLAPRALWAAPRALRAAPRALRLEWIALILLLWLVVMGFWAVAAIRTPYATDPAWLRDPNWVRGFLLGALVGFAAAPWIWLHFSRDISANEQADQSNAKDARNAALDRYRLQTIILGVIVLFLTVGPLLTQMLRSAENVSAGAFGVSLSLAEHPGGPNQAPLLNLGGNGLSSIGGLTDQTLQARRIGNPGAPPKRPPPDIDKMGADLADFDYLSVIDRDRAYIAYLLLAERADLTEILAGADTSTSPDRSLARYIDLAPAGGAEMDMQFVAGTATMFACLNYYAVKIRDLHLYFIDTSTFLKELSIDINSDQTAPPSQDNLNRLATSATGVGPGPMQGEGLQGKIRDVFRRGGLSKDDPDQDGRVACWIGLRWPLAPDLVTPYPALLAAYSLAAVESPEAGLLYLKNWIDKNTPAPGETAGYARRWHLLRAELAVSQIATTTSIQPELPTEPLVAFERKLTDDYADLIHVNSTGGMKKLCERFQTRGIHSGIGRFLAFNYANERNYLFEMETPELLQSWRDGRQHRSLQNLGGDLQESMELFQAVDSDCFDGVPSFEADRRRWRGQFQLNVAQLSVDRLPTLPAAEQDGERANIRRLLDGARDMLGEPPSDAARTAVDRLLSRQSFDTQRQRVTRLRALLNAPTQ